MVKHYRLRHIDSSKPQNQNIYFIELSLNKRLIGTFFLGREQADNKFTFSRNKGFYDISIYGNTSDTEAK